MHPKRSMTQVYLVSMLMLAVLPIVMIGYFWVSQQYQQFDTEVAERRDEYLNSRKRALQDHVAEIIAYINHQKSLTDKQLRENLRQRTQEAFSLISALHQQFPTMVQSSGDGAARDKMLSLAAELLRPIRFNNDRGWYVLMDGRGKILLNPAFPQVENRIAAEISGFAGDSVTADAIRLAKAQGEGYLELHINRADDISQFANRLVYLKYFEPLDLIILSGEYVDDVRQSLQRHVIDVVSNTKHNPERSVPFILNREGVLLAEPARPDLVGKNSSGVLDAGTGEELIAMHRKAAASNGGDFVEYSWQRDGRDGLSKGVSFVQAYPEWDWMVGSGFFLDQLEAEIAAQRESMQKRVAGEMSYVAIGLSVVLLLAMGVASWFAKRSARGFSLFNNFFSEASNSSSYIDKEQLPYSEFSNLADSANLMIAERSRYEKALKRSQRRFKLALKHSRHYVWDVRVDTGKVDLTGGFYESLGYTRDDFDFERIETAYSLCHPDDLPLIQSEFELKKIHKGGIEFRLKDKKGHYRWFFGRGSRLKPEPGDLAAPRLLGIVTEITPRKKIEQELDSTRIVAEDASYSKSQFLATMSHELRTPLNGILGYAQLMRRDQVLPPECQQYLDAIANCGEQLLVTIDDLLQLSKIESGHVELNRQECKLPVILQEIRDIAETKIEAKGLVFKLHVDPSVPGAIVIDATKLKQILVNLIANAIKFTDHGWVELSVTCDENTAELLFNVSDSGIGIASEDMERIFKPFQQVGGLETDGTGLGLTVSRRLAEALQGRLTATSEPGNGSCFSVRIPLSVVLDTVNSPSSMYAGQSGGLIEQRLTGFSTDAVPGRVDIQGKKLQQLQESLRVGDVEALKLLMQAMLDESDTPELRYWLQHGLKLLEHFDMDSVERMIAKVAGPEAVA